MAAAAGCLAAFAADGAVTVIVEPPTVERVEFDPRDPPDDLPGDVEGGAGVCRNLFEIEAAVDSSIEMVAPATVRAHPHSVAITTRLKVTIYTPLGSPAKLRAHEEGHRLIGEHYYGHAEAAARAAAASLLGRSFEADGADRAAAERAVEALVLAELSGEYMRRTHARSQAANARYDARTRHGRDPIAEAAAVAGAIAADQ